MIDFQVFMKQFQGNGFDVKSGFSLHWTSTFTLDHFSMC